MASITEMADYASRCRLLPPYPPKEPAVFGKFRRKTRRKKFRQTAGRCGVLAGQPSTEDMVGQDA
jgi:hypothetical protein